MTTIERNVPPQRMRFIQFFFLGDFDAGSINKLYINESPLQASLIRDDNLLVFNYNRLHRGKRSKWRQKKAVLLICFKKIGLILNL